MSCNINEPGLVVVDN